MSTRLDPVLQRELQMPDEDPDNGGASLKKLKAYVDGLDPQMISLFVAEVSEAIDANDLCEDDAILVFEMLARLHGQKVVPNIGRIMSVILKTLTFGVKSFESCSKVVSAIALYGIDPLASDRDNMKIIQSLSKPLSDALMCFEGNASSGAALCLKGVVNLDVWRFASDEIVNEICLKVTGALGEASTQTNSHIALVMALAEYNTWILEPYARSIIRSGLKILSYCLEDNSSRKCSSVIQMINFLMRRVDARNFFSEIESIIEFMEKCQNDQSPFIQDAAFEALVTAKIIADSGGLLNKLDSNVITGANLCRECEEKASSTGTDYGVNNHCSSPVLPFHESQSVLYDTFVCSAMSCGQSSRNIQCVRHADKRLWSTNTNSHGGAKKDGFFGQRPCSIGDVRMTSTSRRLIPSSRSYSNSTVRNLHEPDFHQCRCPSSEDEAHMLPNETDYHNMLRQRVISENQKIQDGLLRGVEMPSFDSSALVSMQTCNRTCLEDGRNEQTLKLRKFNVSKARFAQICGIPMIFLVIILMARLITNDQVLFDVFPT